MAEEKSSQSDNFIVRLLHKIAAVGNKLPDPVTLFFLIAFGVVLLSWILAGVEAEVMRPVLDDCGNPTGEFAETTVGISSLLTSEGIQWMYLNAISNFTGFAPLGPVLMVMLGIGIAERTGLIAIGLRMLVMSVPRKLITATLIFACVMSSMAADAGYVVMIPLGAMIFAGMGRHPIAGIGAAFAGVSGGFSANLLLTGLDPMLAEITNEAAQGVAGFDQTVAVTANWYFLIASTFLVTAVGTWVTHTFIEPMLGDWDPSEASEPIEEPEKPTPVEQRNFWIAMASAAVVTAGILVLGLWEGSPLRALQGEPEYWWEAMAPFFQRLDVLITLLFFIPGLVYGILNKMIKNDKDVANMASDTMASMGAYVVLAFPAGQFIAYFSHTNLDVVVADRGVQLLEWVGLGGIPLLLGFIVLTGILNLFFGSASAKWAVMGPVFVPMLMLMGLSPEAIQVAYRIGDSVTNIVTPLMPYLPLIIVFARKYVKDIQIGTILTVMLPYSVALAIGWSLMLVAWVYLGIDLGPGAQPFLELD